MIFSRVAQLDAVLLNADVGRLFANYAINVVRNFTGARFDIDAEVAAVTKTAINILHVIRFGVTPGAGLFALSYGERGTLAPSGYWRVRALGCAIVFCVISYLKSRRLLAPITKLSELAVVLNFVAFLVNGVYPTVAERLFDLRLYSHKGPGDLGTMSGHHRELLFHIIMETFDTVNRFSLNVTTRGGLSGRWLSNLLKQWLSYDEQLDKFSCVICKKPPINALRGGISVLDAETETNQCSDQFCECFYCHTCFYTEIAPDLQGLLWDSCCCTKCGKHFPLPRTNYL